MEASQTRKFLVHFTKKFKYLDFCLPEFESLVQLYSPRSTYGAWAPGATSPSLSTFRDRLYCQPRD